NLPRSRPADFQTSSARLSSFGLFKTRDIADHAPYTRYLRRHARGTPPPRRSTSGQLLRPPDRRLEPPLLLHRLDPQLLRRLQLPHVAHVSTLQLELGPALGGDAELAALAAH